MKKRMLSWLLTAAMVLSMLPAGALAARDDPWSYIGLGDMTLVEGGEIPEGAQFPDGLSYAYDESRDVHVLTMENMTLTEPLYIEGDWEAEQKIKVEIVLKGENVIDTREQDYGMHDALCVNSADASIISGGEGASLSLYGFDSTGIRSNHGTLTIDGVTINTRCEMDQETEGGQGLAGDSDFVITGGAELDIFGGWMGIIISGGVTFADCTVNTNRIHVHSRVEEDESGNQISDQRTMTIGEGAVVNINTTEEDIEDSALMLLDGSTLKIAGGVLNCNFDKGPAGWMQIGYSEDIADNTVVLESGEFNVTGNPERFWDAVYVDKGKFVQTGGKLTIRDSYFGLGLGNEGTASFEGGEALFEDCYVGIFVADDINPDNGDVLSVSGGDLTFNVDRFGIYHGGGRASITGGNMEINAGPDPDLEQAICIIGQLVMSDGTVSVVSNGLAMLIDRPGEFVLQGGTMNLQSGDRSALVSYGLTDLRGGELNLRGNAYTYVGIEDGGDYLYLGEGMFVRTEDATLVREYDEEEGVFFDYYANGNNELCNELSFATNGGVFAGQLDVSGSELNVGMPFVVSADLALGEQSGTAVFTLPVGMTVKGQASVNGAAVNSVYDESSNTLSVPLTKPGVAVRFYAVPKQTMEDAQITCDVTVNETTHTLTCGEIAVDGLRVTLPGTTSVLTLPLSGTAAPGGMIYVYDISEEDNPVLLNEGAIAVDALGYFDGSITLPEPTGDTEIHTYRLRAELEDENGTLIDAEETKVAYTSHAATLKYLNIQNEYHGAKMEEILRNDIVVDYEFGTVAINESTATKAYNYFPEYPDFFFAAAFDEPHTGGCCIDDELGETSHIIEVVVEATGNRGQHATVPLYYNRENQRFEGWYSFPDWAPETFAVYWVEEGVVNRESFYQAAIDNMASYGESARSYEDILAQATEEVENSMEAYFNALTEVKVDDNHYEYYDSDDERIFSLKLETLDYTQLDLTGFEDVRGDGELWFKAEHNPDDYSVSMTVAAQKEGYDPVALRQTMYIEYVPAQALMVRAVSRATAGQRAAVYTAKHIPKVGDVVQAVDSKLLHDSLIDFDTQFSNDLMRLTDTISSTMHYRCPYNGKQMPRANTEDAARILQELLDLQTRYNQEYQENKENIREDMKESLVNGVTLGINKFGNKKMKAALELYGELEDQLDTLEGYREDLEYVQDLIQDPEGTLQQTFDELMTPEGMLSAGAEYAADKGWIDDDTKELLNDLANPDSTYRDAHEFMVKYQDELTRLTDEYTEALRKELEGQIDMGGQDDCKPPEDPENPDPPALPPKAGGEEIPIPAIKDPSGYVYEAVEANRLSDVTTTLYHYDGEEAPTQNADELELEPWDAAPFNNQSNPLTTDALGQYQWMVPDGWWQVKYEKDGYETVYSQWLPVPPPQTEVNIGMVNLSQPNFTFADGDSCYFITSDRYLFADSVEMALMEGENEAYSYMVALDTTVAPDGVTRLATQFQLFYDKGAYPQPTRAMLQITSATTYAGVSLDNPVEKQVTLNPSNPTVFSWEGDQCTVSLNRELAEYIMPFAAGYKEGVMTACVPLTMDGVTLTGDKVLVFFLETDSFAPLCPPIPSYPGE